jgi:hypothetical protein
VTSKKAISVEWMKLGGNGFKKEGEAAEWSRETMIPGEEFGVTGLCI